MTSQSLLCPREQYYDFKNEYCCIDDNHFVLSVPIRKSIEEISEIDKQFQLKQEYKKYKPFTKGVKSLYNLLNAKEENV